MKKLGLVIIGIVSVFSGFGQTLDWAKSFGGTSFDLGYAITVDVSGNVYTTGPFFSATADFDPGSGVFNLTNNGTSGYDIFIQKLDANGNFLWAKSIGGTGTDDAPYSIKLDASGNVYITGTFGNTVDFDPGAGTFNLTASGSNADMFVLKLDANGNFLWAKSFGGTGYDVAYSSSIDGSGNIYTTGYFEGTADFDPGAGTANLTSAGGSDVFVQKLDANGNFVWAKSFGGTGTDEGRSISVDGSGNAYTTGHFQGTGDFDPGAGTTNLTSAGGYDVFVQKLDANGNFLWTNSAGGTADDFGYANTIDASGNVHSTGAFRNIVDFDPGAGTLNLTSSGSTDIFVQKLDANGNLLWAKSFGGTDSDQGKSITVDASGKVYTTGNFRATANFDPGAGTLNLTSTGSADGFVQALDASGNIIWAFSFGGTSSDSGNSLTVDGSGDVYTTGNFQNTVDFDPGAGTTNLVSIGSNDCFVQKLSESITTNTDVIKNGYGTDILIYPNPTSGNFSINLDSSHEKAQIIITDILGKVIQSQNITQAQTLNLSIENKPAGIYFVSILADTKKTVIRLVKK